MRNITQSHDNPLLLPRHWQIPNCTKITVEWKSVKVNRTHYVIAR